MFTRNGFDLYITPRDMLMHKVEIDIDVLGASVINWVGDNVSDQ